MTMLTTIKLLYSCQLVYRKYWSRTFRCGQVTCEQQGWVYQPTYPATTDHRSLSLYTLVYYSRLIAHSISGINYVIECTLTDKAVNIGRCDEIYKNGAGKINVCKLFLSTIITIYLLLCTNNCVSMYVHVCMYVCMYV